MDDGTELETSEGHRSASRPRHAGPDVEPAPASRWLRPEFFFLPAFLIVGAIFIAWVPAGWNADEPAHAYRTAQIASGQILPTVISPPPSRLVSVGDRKAVGSTAVGGQVPNDLIALFALTKVPNGVVFQPSFKVNHLYTPSEERAAHPSGDTFADFRNTALYSPVAYVPEVVAFWVADAINLDPMNEVQLARALSLVVGGVAWTVAIGVATRGKWLLTVFGLLPSVVSQSAALSADGMLLAVTALFVAMWVRCIWRERPTSRGDLLVLTALAVLLGLCKVAYAPLALILVAVPFVNRKGSRFRAILLAAGMLAVAWFPAIAWSLATRAANVSLNATANIHEQVSWIENHPIGFAHVLYKSFLGVPSSDLALSVFGNFVWFSAGVPAAYALFGAGALAISRYVGDQREVHTLARQGMAVSTWAMVVVVITGLVVALGIYLTFVPVGKSYVVALTGRYFLPPLLVALIAFNGNRVMNQNSARRTVLVLSVLLSMGGLLTVHHRLFG